MQPGPIILWMGLLGAAVLLLALACLLTLRMRRDAARARQAEGQLAVNQAHLDLVLENIPSAFLVLDTDLNLISYNHRFLEMFALPEDAVYPGIPVAVPIRLIAERGGYGKGPVEELVARRLEELRGALSDPALATKEIALIDERVGQAQYARTPDGQLVGILTDITEQKENEAALGMAYDVIKDAYDLSQEQKTRMENELNIAHEIQMSMIPLDFPPASDHAPFSLFATLHPAREVGGDFYDFFFIDDTRLYFCIGDVSGKGVPSALFMAVAKALMKSRASDDTSTGSILTHVNNELGADNKSQLFVTVFLGILNVKTGELLYTNGGHNPPYLRRHDGALQCLDQVHGPIVGAFQGMPYEEGSLRMAPGELLFLFTDGVTEARSREGEMFSEQGLEAVLGGLEEVRPQAAIDTTLEAVKTFARRADQSDDITMLAVQYLGAGS